MHSKCMWWSLIVCDPHRRTDSNIRGLIWKFKHSKPLEVLAHVPKKRIDTGNKTKVKLIIENRWRDEKALNCGNFIFLWRHLNVLVIFLQREESEKESILLIMHYRTSFAPFAKNCVKKTVLNYGTFVLHKLNHMWATPLQLREVKYRYV